MQIRLQSLALAFFVTVICAPPSRAEWKETLIRSIAPTLANRGMIYLLRNTQAVHPQPTSTAGSYAAPIDSVAYQPRIERPSMKTRNLSAQKQLPPKPIITNAEMGTGPTKQTGSSKSVSRSSPQSSLLSIPPPPRSMVPPPPPGVPSGAILGLYPEELAPLATEELPQAEMAVMPKVAPDFRKTR